MSDTKAITKKETIELMHQETGFTKKDLNIMYDAFINAILDTLRDDKKFSVRGVMTMASYMRKATQRRNPQTGDVIDVPEKKAVRFVAGKLLKEAIN